MAYTFLCGDGIMAGATTLLERLQQTAFSNQREAPSVLYVDLYELRMRDMTPLDIVQSLSKEMASAKAAGVIRINAYIVLGSNDMLPYAYLGILLHRMGFAIDVNCGKMYQFKGVAYEEVLLFKLL